MGTGFSLVLAVVIYFNEVEQRNYVDVINMVAGIHTAIEENNKLLHIDIAEVNNKLDNNLAIHETGLALLKRGIADADVRVSSLEDTCCFGEEEEKHE
jgi:hypothetical protein